MAEHRRNPEAATTSAGHLLEIIRLGRAHSRSELSRLTGMSRTAVVSRVAALTEAGLVTDVDQLESTGGRPASGLAFHSSAGVVLAAAIGRSRAQVAVMDLDGAERTSRSLDLTEGAGPDVVMPLVADALAELTDGIHAPIYGIGVSLPGTVDPERGTSESSPVMRGWDGVELGPYLAALGPDVPLFLGNDAHVLALSERLGHAARFGDLVVVKASTGLGLGIMTEGRILRGHLGGAGDIGHTKVPGAEGRTCRCGDTGCLETVAAGWALVAELADTGTQVSHVRELVALAQAGDAEARRLLRQSGRQLGSLLSTAVNLLNPQAIILGGDMAAAFDVYAEGVRESIYGNVTALAARRLQVLPATHGDRAGLVGCAALALDHVLSPSAVDARLSRLGQGNDSAE